MSRQQQAEYAPYCADQRQRIFAQPQGHGAHGNHLQTERGLEMIGAAVFFASEAINALFQPQHGQDHSGQTGDPRGHQRRKKQTGEAQKQQ